MWVRELDAFVESYSRYKSERAQMYLAKPEPKPVKASAKSTAGTTAKKGKQPINSK